MATHGRVALRVRTEFTSIREEDITKYLGQEDISQVAGLDNVLAERVVSRPAAGQRQIYNIVWDPANKELIIEVSETDAE